MDDTLREELATLGQRLELNRVERRDAFHVIRARLRKHRDDVSVAHVARLTTLSPSTLYAMLRDDE